MSGAEQLWAFHCLPVRCNPFTCDMSRGCSMPMNDDDFKTLSSDQLKLIDDICSEFDRNLQTGEICAIDQLTAGAPAGLQSQIQQELLATEIEFRRATQAELHAEELRRRFPAVGKATVEELLQHVAGATDDTANLEVTRADVGDETAEASSDLQKIGPYQLQKEIGRGGMGKVYRAIHSKLKRTVALKVLSPSVAQHETAVERFQREMAAVGMLQHPNIVQATDAGESEGVHYLAM